MNIFAAGFMEKECSRLEHVVSLKGHQLVVLEEDPYSFLCENDSSLAVVIGVRNSEDLKFVKKVTVNASNHFYAFGVEYGKREVLFQVSATLIASFFFFLPADEAEIKKTISRLINAVTESREKKGVFFGLQKLVHSFEWETHNLKITQTSKYIAGILKLAGFAEGVGEEDRMVLSIEEALLNSIEHGNLELASSLRPNDIFEEDRYEELRTKRMNSDEYGRRKIYMNVEIEDNRVMIKIKDEGKGFDTSGCRKQNSEECGGGFSREKVLKVSGKGSQLISSSFDQMFYNEKGNEITLIKISDRKGG